MLYPLLSKIVPQEAHQIARQWLVWWNHFNVTVQRREAVKVQVFEQSSAPVQFLWDPLRWWMERVHMGLHVLEMWERRTDGGHTQARMQEIYLESCRQASS